MMQKHILLCIILGTICVEADPEADSYLQLIEDLLNYTLPVDNSEFTKIPLLPKLFYGTFDFIIVGAGSAGCVLANRLSEVPSWKILLVEAGGEESDISDIPAAMPLLWLSDRNWGYYTTAQTGGCQGMIGHKCFFPRGKGIGGSSSINAMIYARGNRKDFDNWAQLGNTGWSYDEVLPYFKKSENTEIPGADPGYHGTGGPRNVEYSNPNGPALQNYIEANEEIGLNSIDYNGAEEVGVSQIQYTTKNGRRHSTGRAFLDVVRNRPNLKIVTRALATKIRFDTSKTARGIEFRKNGIEYIALASKEVLVSAGSINTPQLLMLSGVGPSQHLQDLGIPVIKDLPVGRHLQDHALFMGLEFRTNLTVLQPTLVEAGAQYYFNGSGPLTRPADLAGITFSSKLVSETGAPKLEYAFIANDPMGLAFTPFFNVRPDIQLLYGGQINQATDFKVVATNLHPESEGSVTLQSSNPIDFPLIETAFYTDPGGVDIETIYQGILEILRLAETEAFRRIDATFIEYPFCTEFEPLSKDYWYCYIRDLTTTFFHPVSTCRMGTDSQTSVVDNNLKIHGLNRVRVIDASVFPTTTSGHTDAPTVMIAEKGADIIKNDYGVI